MVNNYNKYNSKAISNDSTFRTDSIKKISLIEKHEGFFVIKVERKIFRTKLPNNFKVGDEIIARISSYNPFTIVLNNFIGYNSLTRIRERVLFLLDRKDDYLVRETLNTILLQNIVITTEYFDKILSFVKSNYKSKNIFIPNLVALYRVFKENDKIKRYKDELCVNPGVAFLNSEKEIDSVNFDEEIDEQKLVQLRNILSGELDKTDNTYKLQQSVFKSVYNYPVYFNVSYRTNSFTIIAINSQFNPQIKFGSLLLAIISDHKIVTLFEINFLHNPDIFLIDTDSEVENKIYKSGDICTLVENYHSKVGKISLTTPNIEVMYKKYGYNPFDVLFPLVDENVSIEAKNAIYDNIELPENEGSSLLNTGEISLVYILIRNIIKKHLLVENG